MRMFKWQARWTRLVIALSRIAAFVIASGAGWRSSCSGQRGEGKRMPEQDPTSYSPRLRTLIASALALSIPVLVGAAVSLALHPPGLAEGLPVLLFRALALLAELKPVPLEEDDLSTVSLAFVFILASVILFGWQEAVLVAAVSACAAQIAEKK